MCRNCNFGKLESKTDSTIGIAGKERNKGIHIADTLGRQSLEYPCDIADRLRPAVEYPVRQLPVEQLLVKELPQVAQVAERLVLAPA